jgi:hypothetical protein
LRIRNPDFNGLSSDREQRITPACKKAGWFETGGVDRRVADGRCYPPFD